MLGDGCYPEGREALPDRAPKRVAASLVTQVDGTGRGSIGLSVASGLERRTAAFLCDVRSGICDAIGEVEPESPSAGALLDELADQAESDCIRNVPELALGLLSGSLTTSAGAVPPTVREWLDLMFGPEFQGSAFPATIPGIDPPSISAIEMAGRMRDFARPLPILAGSFTIDFRACRRNPPARGKPKPRSHPRCGDLPLPLRTPADRST